MIEYKQSLDVISQFWKEKVLQMCLIKCIKKEKLSFQMCVKVEQMMLLEKAVSVTLPLNRDMQGNEQFLTIVATVNYHTNTSNLRLQYVQAFRAA